MIVFFKDLNGQCYEINCSCDIQLGKLFQLFSEKLTEVFKLTSEEKPLRGISVAKIGNIMPMKSDIYWNNTLEELNIIGDVYSFLQHYKQNYKQKLYIREWTGK